MKNKMKLYRKKLGLTKYALSKATGVSETMVGQVESGKRSPGLKIARALAKALGVTTDELFQE